MKTQLLMTSILAFGMGVAQAQTPMQGGAQEPKSPSTQQPMPGSGTGPATAGTTGAGTTDQTAPQSFKGCLTGSPGSWNLAADNGQTLKVSGTDEQLSSYNNQQVNIQGTQATDGSIQVASIDKIADSCTATGQAATGPASTEQNVTTQPPATSTTGPATGAAAPSQGTTGAAPAPSPATGTPPVTEQTQATTVGGATSDQGAAQKPPAGTTGQTATPGTEPGTGHGAVPHISDMDEQKGTAATGEQAAGQQLPRTASPLPLLGLIGLGSLAAGLVARRKK